MKDYNKVTVDAAKGASKGALLAGAASIASGIATASVPVKVLGLITVGTSTVVSAPIVAGVAVGGALIGAATGAYLSYRKQAQIEAKFDELTKSE